jgi:hypothetical protein
MSAYIENWRDVEPSGWEEWPVEAKIDFYRRLQGMPSTSKSRTWPALSQLRNKKTGKLYHPNSPETLAFHLSPARYRLLQGGLGSGKTAAGSIEALKRIKAGQPGAIVSPDNNHFEKSAFEEFAAWCPWNHLAVENKSKRWWQFDTGAKVFYGGIDDPEAWTGPNLNWVWFDEAARKGDDHAWRVLIGRIRIGPAPAMWITTTPKPHWLKRVFYVSPPSIEGKPLTMAFKLATSANKANLDPLYYASLEASYTGRYADQQLRGEMVVFEGVVYDTFSLETWPAGNLCDEDPDLSLENPDKPELGLKYPLELYFDDGYNPDPRVIGWVQKKPGSILVFDEICHRQHLEETCVREVKERGWPFAELAIGSPEAKALHEYFRMANIPVRFEGHEIAERIPIVRRLLCDGNGRRIVKVNRRCHNFISEFSEGYRYPEGKGDFGEISSNKPVDKDNHSADGFGAWCYVRARREFMETT